MPFTFVYRTADIYSALSKLPESAGISAVRYTNLNSIVSKVRLKFHGER